MNENETENETLTSYSVKLSADDIKTLRDLTGVDQVATAIRALIRRAKKEL